MALTQHVLHGQLGVYKNTQPFYIASPTPIPVNVINKKVTVFVANRFKCLKRKEKT